jgi:undecaprenyl-diphosphatase
MLDYLVKLDIKIFYLVNNHSANPFFDWFMPIITTRDYWIGVFILLWLFLFVKGGKIGRLVAILIIPTLILADQSSSHVFKPLIGRIRPCYTLENVRLLVGCGGKFSFPSGHATNSFATALLFSYFYRNYTFLLLGTAALISFSRVYVGVHYPADVFGGMILGLISGALVIILYKATSTSFVKKRIWQMIRGFKKT